MTRIGKLIYFGDNNRSQFDNMEIREFVHIDAAGSSYRIERLENRLEVSAFEYDRQIKKSCEGCRNHTVNLSCPPHSPYFPDYIENAKAADVICFRVPLDKFTTAPVREAYHAAFTVVRNLLISELLEGRKVGHIVAGSGACLVCNPCAGESGDTNCRFPDKRIYSLESLGVNVISLSEKAFELELEWSDDTHTARYVSAIGAAFR
jgi:predicted metal-binding protein